MRKRFTWTPILLLYLLKLIDHFKKRYDLFYRARAPVENVTTNYKNQTIIT